MVEHSDTLLTIGEIAVAFAGFAGIASVLARGHKSLDPRVNALRLHNMVDIALSVVVLAFAPLLLWELLSKMLPNTAWFWRITSFFAFLWASAMYVRLNRRSRPLEKMAGYNTEGHKRLRLIAFGGLISVASNIVLPAHDYMYAAYLAGVFAALTGCGILFMRILNSLLLIAVTDHEAQNEELDRD